MNIKHIAVLVVGLSAISASAQLVSAPSGVVPLNQVLQAEPPAQPPVPTPTSFFGSVQGYFTSFNTNLDGTFQSKATLWTGADSIQGGTVTLANALGISYRAYGILSVESVTRNSGIAGTLLSEQVGPSVNFLVHDTKLTIYADAGYAFGEERGNKFYGEVGVRVSKALTEHTFAGIGVGGQFPANRQVFQAFAGFTF